MNWLIAFHIIAVVCWFAGLFYLPRLFVYHVQTDNQLLNDQFKIMEHRLYYYIMMPAAIMTLLFGLSLWLPHYTFYSHQMWLHLKLILVLFLYTYHFYLGYLLQQFKSNHNQHSENFYRWLNEIPTLLLIIIVILVVVKPF
ncbi:MAG: TIGR00701 family protein [Gammaproteobacteria bacterium RIFCSPHIGHO2_12_FULL_35_23]|nr:MAG: TIGR00701 family protein [Gammaproteobacteria bacterium RIFCSPHIGHO2_12_FULL_35_23]